MLKVPLFPLALVNRFLITAAHKSQTIFKPFLWMLTIIEFPCFPPSLQLFFPLVISALMAEPNEITLLFTHILIEKKKKIPPRLICMCPSNLRLHCIPCLLPVRILCFNRCLFTAEKLINPNACLTKFENTKKQSCAQPDCLHGFASHMCNYSRRWQINYLLGLCVTMIYNVLGCESKSEKSGGMGEDGRGFREW